MSAAGQLQPVIVQSAEGQQQSLPGHKRALNHSNFDAI